MNTELRRMMVEAEGRWLADAELARLRDYALALPARLDAARRLQAAEGIILARAGELFATRHAEYITRVPDAGTKVARDMALTLRYLASAHVRADPEFFKKSYAAWIGQLLLALVASDVLISGQECLRTAIEESLDPADARAFVRFLDMFIEELSR